MAQESSNNNGLPSPAPEAVGPGHYGTLGVHQGASNRCIMDAYDALEKRAVEALTYDEPTTEQKAAQEARLEEVSSEEDDAASHKLTASQLRTAAKILNDSKTRRLYDRELSGGTIDWAAEARSAYEGYEDFDCPRRRPHSRRHNSGRKQPRPSTDHYEPPVTYPDIWIAAVHGRSWRAPAPRSDSPSMRPTRPSPSYGRYSPSQKGHHN
ncbi:hypothetical protein PRZ48_005684 [Zasmidium cellare]|uniref:J domain-containing protein n=1 Tax=Zasmidium cellare TaxID=395010 RepID=A0ABR0ELI8_ZASCE|nr:hypothetical protein PRZ48_005684 [Zasmidium cellare]